MSFVSSSCVVFFLLFFSSHSSSRFFWGSFAFSSFVSRVFCPRAGCLRISLERSSLLFLSFLRFLLFSLSCLCSWHCRSISLRYLCRFVSLQKKASSSLLPLFCLRRISWRENSLWVEASRRDSYHRSKIEIWSNTINSLDVFHLPLLFCLSRKEQETSHSLTRRRKNNRQKMKLISLFSCLPSLQGILINWRSSDFTH